MICCCLFVCVFLAAWQTACVLHRHDHRESHDPLFVGVSVCVCGWEVGMAGLPVCGLLHQASNHSHQIRATGNICVCMCARAHVCACMCVHAWMCVLYVFVYLH